MASKSATEFSWLVGSLQLHFLEPECEIGLVVKPVGGVGGLKRVGCTFGLKTTLSVTRRQQEGGRKGIETDGIAFFLNRSGFWFGRFSARKGGNVVLG